jgi:hypothetical protein
VLYLEFIGFQHSLTRPFFLISQFLDFNFIQPREFNMARPKITTSQRIREVLSEDPNLTGPEIIEVLARRGIKAKKALVYFVKARFKAKKRRQARQKAATVVSGNGVADPVVLISRTKALAAEVGGMSKLKELVAALSE